MSQAREGFFIRHFRKEGTSGRGAWVATSLKVSAPNGVEDPMFYQLGFVEPPAVLQPGVYLKFQVEPKDARAMTVVKGSLTVHQPGDAGVPEQAAGTPAATATPPARSAKGFHSELFGGIGGYFTEDDISRITFSSSRDQAITLVGIMLEHNALPLPSTTTKAGEAKAHEAVLNAVNKIAVQFYYDTASRRVLDSVVDSGRTEVAVDAAVPDAPKPVEFADVKANVSGTGNAANAAPPPPPAAGEVVPF